MENITAIVVLAFALLLLAVQGAFLPANYKSIWHPVGRESASNKYSVSDHALLMTETPVPAPVPPIPPVVPEAIPTPDPVPNIPGPARDLPREPDLPSPVETPRVSPPGRDPVEM